MLTQSKARRRLVSIKGDAEPRFDGVPVLPHTVLLLEIEMGERCVDLSRFSKVVLSDLGATIRLLQLVGKVYGRSAALVRIEDFIADFGVLACFNAISKQVATYDARYSRITTLWAHCKDAAETSRDFTDELLEINSDEAYLAGLLHAARELPHVLGWKDGCYVNMGNLEFARHMSLPDFVTAFICGSGGAGVSSHWSSIVGDSCRYADHSCVPCTRETNSNLNPNQTSEIPLGAPHQLRSVAGSLAF